MEFPELLAACTDLVETRCGSALPLYQDPTSGQLAGLRCTRLVEVGRGPRVRRAAWDDLVEERGWPSTGCPGSKCGTCSRRWRRRLPGARSSRSPVSSPTCSGPTR